MPRVLLMLALAAAAVMAGAGPSGPVDPAPAGSLPDGPATPHLRSAPVSDLRSPQAPGILEGTVRLEAPPATDPPRLSPYARRRYRPPSASSTRRSGPGDVVVFVLVDEPRAPNRDTTVRIVQRDRTIIPHVTAVRAGTAIAFPNEDDVYHNLFSLSEPHPFNLGRYPPGESRTEVFERRGVVRLFCDIHSEMNAVIRVVDTPHFTRPDESGAFRIQGVPAGRRRVVAWHESAGADTATVDVPAGGTGRTVFQLGR